MLPDLQALLECLVIAVECPHCGHRCDRIVGPIKSGGVYTCPACARAAIIDSSRLDDEVAAAAERLRERALELGRSLERGVQDSHDDWPRPAGRPDDEPS